MRCWDTCSHQAAREERANGTRPKPPPLRLAHGVSEPRPPISPPLVCSSVGPSHPELPIPTQQQAFLCFTSAQTETSDPCRLFLWP